MYSPDFTFQIWNHLRHVEHHTVFPSLPDLVSIVYGATDETVGPTGWSPTRPHNFVVGISP